jgi:hypothetical protein
VLSITEQRHALRVHGAAGPGADLGGPRADPRRADHRRGRPPGYDRRQPGLLARADEQEALLRLSLGDPAPPPSWPAICPSPAAACCWPPSRWPPVITTPCRAPAGSGPGRPDATPCAGAPDTAGRRRH